MGKNLSAPDTGLTQAIAEAELLLKWYEDFQGNVFSQLESLLFNTQSKSIAQSYRQHKRSNVDLGFNVFSIVTDTYKRENLHSYIIHAFLDPRSSHGEGYVFLHLFIHYLHAHKFHISVDDYRNAEVYRERDRIDISIVDPKSKKAIIIENKINGAGDQQRQIPRYVKILVDDGYVIDVVVYLQASGTKAPEHLDWTEAEKELIGKKTIVVSAFREQANDLVHGWIDPCVKAASNIDVLVLFRQYRLLLQKIANSDMNKQLMEQFHKLMLTDNHYKNALSLRDMVNSLTNYRVEHIIDKFNGRTEPFNKGINRWNNIAFMEDSVTNLVIDIGVHEEKYIVEFFNRKYDRGEVNENTALGILQELGMEDRFEVFNKRFKTRFRFPEEELQMFEFGQDFQKKLGRVLEKAKAALN